MSDIESPAPNPDDYVRLHITPFNPSILPSIVPAALLPKARNISYHSIPTFPEKPYGFVELPVMEAEKIKKKLKGAILKGTKVRIEEARPEKRSRNEEEEEMPSIITKEKSSKRRRRDTETIPAVELHDRNVKRGWTDPDAPARSEKKKSKKDKKEKKEAVRSKYTSGPECLFRTTLPANSSAADGVSSDATNARKKSGKGKEAVIHEFSKTVKHATFLRDSTITSAKKGASEYIEGEGWVNQDGEVIEGPVEKKRRKKTKTRTNQEKDETTDSDSAASSEIEDSSEDESLAEKEQALRAIPEKVVKVAKFDDDLTSSSGESSEDSETESNSTSDSASKKDVSPTPETPDEASRPVSSSGAPLGLTISIPKSVGETGQKANVHPLEALYKRRKPDSEAPRVAETPPSFSFFGPDNDEDEGEHQSFVIPMTPFTQQDFAHRGQRSAAPTPDTAHPSRLSQIKWPVRKFDDEDDDIEEAEAPNTPSNKKKDSKMATIEAPGDDVSSFEKLFYEQRGEHNRGWKKQAKAAAKEKRNSENRKRRDRAI